MSNEQANNHVFQTEYLPLACYLHAANKLKFIGANPKPDGIVMFKFEDTENEGEQLHSDFEGGAECSATAFYHSLRYLRRVMDQTRGTRKGEQTYESRIRSSSSANTNDGNRHKDNSQ